jgi:hypothetical protein
MDRPFAKKQILRMAQMNRFPVQAEPMGELVDALLTAPSEEMAVDVIFCIMRDADGNTPCPMGSDLRRLILERLEPVSTDPDCKACGGCGFVFTERGGMTGTKNCLCWARRPKFEYRNQGGPPKDLTRELKKASKVLAGENP